MIHIYCGDGKGKTTAACGLAVRAAGSGMKVLFAQYFKSGISSEVAELSKLGISTLNAGSEFGDNKNAGSTEKAGDGGKYQRLTEEIIQNSGAFDMIIFDEVISAYNYLMLDGEAFIEYLRRERNVRELILTGRNPCPELVELADYVTEMQKLKHPYDSGQTARRGIEF